ncbi:MAG: hypothetical protein FWG20_07165 [Candidatus Cloacimonetes bacterium]|nr:hypothetical protein [Candidatus Cloacimonadota bacterium]
MKYWDGLWIGYDYLEEKEPFFEIQTDERYLDDFEIDVICQTKKEMDTKYIEQIPDFGIEHISSNGDVYIVREKCIHRLAPKVPMRTTLSHDNELLKEPADPTRFLYIPPLKRQK